MKTSSSILHTIDHTKLSLHRKHHHGRFECLFSTGWQGIYHHSGWCNLIHCCLSAIAIWWQWGIFEQYEQKQSSTKNKTFIKVWSYLSTLCLHFRLFAPKCSVWCRILIDFQHFEDTHQAWIVLVSNSIRIYMAIKVLQAALLRVCFCTLSRHWHMLCRNLLLLITFKFLLNLNKIV